MTEYNNLIKLDKNFYKRDALTVAPKLLGKYLVRNINGHTLVAVITETEAYRSDDKACHAYNYRLTPRTSTMFREGGCAYIYFTYGMYHCLNVVTDIEGEPSAVLIRGIKPVYNMEYMSYLRYKKPLCDITKYQLDNFSNGPGKVCMAYSLDRSLDGEDLTSDTLYIAEGEEVTAYSTGKRIGIDYAGDAKDYLWRFYI